MKLDVSFYYVGNIEKATEMYSKFLGKKPVYADDDWVRFELDGGNLALHLNENLEETSSEASVRYGATVSFSVHDIQETVDLARQTGFDLVGKIREQPFGKLAELRDSWGNRISLLEPPKK